VTHFCTDNKKVISILTLTLLLTLNLQSVWTMHWPCTLAKPSAPACQGQLSLPSLWGRQMSTSFGWEGKCRYVYSVSRCVRGVQVKLWDPLRTRAIPERLIGVWSRQGAIQIHVHLTVYLTCQW